jgi:hypothetical protein
MKTKYPTSVTSNCFDVPNLGKNNSLEIRELREVAKALMRRLEEISDGKDQELACSGLLWLWALAQDSTHQLNKRVFQKYYIENHAHLRAFLLEKIKSREFFPINFNEKIDMIPYRKLSIGYSLLESKNPKSRSGESAFSLYAKKLIKHLLYSVLKQKAIRDGVGSKSSKLFRSKYGRDPMIQVPTAFRWGDKSFPKLDFGTIPFRPFRSPHFRKPTKEEKDFTKRLKQVDVTADVNFKRLVELPEFSKTSAKKWAEASKDLFKKAYPKCEEIESLAMAIGDGEVKYESQIRARIIERIGRAVLALARE